MRFNESRGIALNADASNNPFSAFWEIIWPIFDTNAKHFFIFIIVFLPKNLFVLMYPFEDNYRRSVRTNNENIVKGLSSARRKLITAIYPWNSYE